MAYHTTLYLFVFLPLALICYQVVPQKWRGCVLIGFSYLFFWMNSKGLLVYLIGTTLLTHHIAIWLDGLSIKAENGEAEEKKQIKKQKKSVLFLGIFILLGVLIGMKYQNFVGLNMFRAAERLSIPYSFDPVSIVLPLGISFYTLQAIGYMADVYWGKIKADYSLEKTALFLSFFPQIMEGPICRYSDTAGTLYKKNPLKLENLQHGSLRIVWGLFKKLVIADRLAIVVKTIFDGYENYHGILIVAAALAYTIQLYMEFSGAIDMVIGTGVMFGVKLPENFRQPFFAENASGFWRRWHITLGVWFKEYIFYPVSVSRLVKKWNRYGRKHVGKYLTKIVTSAVALFPVWLCNGIWHGPRWSYIFYGMYYFTLIMVGILLEPIRKKVLKTLHINPGKLWFRSLQFVKLMLIVITGELFFRADSLRIGVRMFRSIFHDFDPSILYNGQLPALGIDNLDFMVVLAGCLVVLLVDIMKERKVALTEKMEHWRLPLRWSVYYGLILAVIIFGAYGEGYQVIDLIYAGF